MPYTVTMNDDFFSRAAWYLTTHTDTLSVPEWKAVLEGVFTTFLAGTAVSKPGSMAESKAEVFQMVKYWCVEVGTGYRGKMAAHKFKKCYRWDDYYASKNDPDHFVETQFGIMVQTKKTIDTWTDVLNKMDTVDPEQVWVDPRTREGMRILVEGAKKRYGDEHEKFVDLYAKLATTVTSRPLIILSEGWNWERKLDTLRTEGSIMTELIFRYGDGLRDMKLDMMKGGERS